MDPVQKTLVAELAPLAYRASSLGGFQMIIGLCAFPASLVAGIMWEKLGIFIPFYFSLGLTVIASIILLFVKERKDN
jgi:MFS family permease